MDIRFDSEACIETADESMELVAYHAIAASAELANERGAYEAYKGSKWIAVFSARHYRIT